MNDRQATDEISPEQRLEEIREILKSGGDGETVSVRELLRWFGAQRRGVVVTAVISETLSAMELKTEPDFDSVWIDAPVRFVLEGDAVTEKNVEARAPSRPNEEIRENIVEAWGQVERLGVLRTFQIGRLPSANGKVISVNPNTNIKEVATIMMMEDFSQVPVLTTPREIKGAVSWKSIALSHVFGGGGSEAREFQEEVIVLDTTASLFDAVKIISEKDYVFIKNESREICGIVTGDDLAIQFQQLAEPFLLISEIELYLRSALKDHVTQDEIRAAIAEDRKDDASKDENRVIKVDDLTFGELINLLISDEVWRKTILCSYDRKIVNRYLEEVRKIRNDVMHFNPDPNDQAIEQLRKFSRFIKVADRT